MGWTWYLGNDFIFYAISPLLVFLLVRRPVAGWVALAVLMVGSFASSWVYIGAKSCGMYLLNQTEYKNYTVNSHLVHISPTASRPYLALISPISRPHLAQISNLAHIAHFSPSCHPHLAHTSSTSCPHLAQISPTSRPHLALISPSSRPHFAHVACRICSRPRRPPQHA